MRRSTRLLPVALLAVLAAPPALAALGPIAPYLQAGTPTTMTVMWRSAAPVAGRVVFGPEGSTKTRELAIGVGTWHQAVLTGLTPGGTYRYEAFDGATRVGGGTFRANLPKTSTRFRFAVIGDSGSGTAHQMNVARRLTAWKPDFVLHTGDVIYERGEAELFGPRFFTPYKDLVARAVVYPSIGNHDYGNAGAAHYLQHFEAPRADATATERWYTFDYGQAQFFALDTNRPFGEGSEQYRWLAAQLAASKAAWKFAFFHHPPYSGGDHGSSHYVRRAFGPLFERHDVQVVFTGHDHHYERVKPREDFVKDGTPTTYLVSGGGGAWLRSARPQPFSAMVRSTYHFLGVTVAGDRLTGEAIDETGATFDAWSVPRNGTP